MNPEIKNFLNQVVADYHQTAYLQSDPLEFVHHYSDPWDKEAVALVSAVLAYGNVKQIRNSVRGCLERISQLSESPKDFVKNLERPSFRKKSTQIFENYVHRFNQGKDLVTLFSLLSKSWRRYGSLGNHFFEFLPPNEEDISAPLSALIKEWKAGLDSDTPSTFSYLLTSPEDGSCCKRWCMFLRWMGRKDRLDPGLWTKYGAFASHFSQKRYLASKQLVMPLDTHTGRISQALGLTLRKSLNWQAALEVTQSLKKFDPNDPTRYDFALCRLGILDIETRFPQLQNLKRGSHKTKLGN